MDARPIRAACIAVALLVLCAPSAWAGSHRTQNFIVTAPTAQLAREIGDTAEAYREQLALEWLGRPMQPWPEPCPITAQVAPNLGAGGATSFYFDNGRPFGWTMSIQGSRERVLDSVLPHEITHTIFATHFGRPLPRWADEGACTTVEHASERNKQEKMLIEFLNTKRSIAFNRMFAMKEYPADVLPLYSQGFSLARFLIALGGKPKFVQYVGDGMQTNNWHAATSRHYGFTDLSDLQLTWVEWVRSGSQEQEAVAFSPLVDQPHPSVMHLVSARTPNRNLAQANLPKAPANGTLAKNELAPVPPTANRNSVTAVSLTPNSTNNSALISSSSDGWYAKQRDRAKSNGLVATTSATTSEPVPRVASNTNAAGMQLVTRPQPPEQARQVILEWSRPGPQGMGMPQPTGTVLR